MNNLLTFEEFINEWKKVEIVINDDDNSMTINKDGKHTYNIPANDKDNKRILTLFSDNRELIKNVTGLSDRDDFLDNFLKDEIINPIKNLKDNSIKIFPEDKKDFIFIDIKNNDNIENIFKLVPSSSKDIGKGEVLMSCYYSNVNRLLITSQSGILGGDCYYYNIDKYNNNKNEDIEADGYIEVKSGGTPFRKLSSYIDMGLFKKLTKNITLDENKKFIIISNINDFKIETNEDIFIKEKELYIKCNSNYDYIFGLSLRFLKYMSYANTKFKFSNKPLYITFFDNKYEGKNKADTKIKGYLQILINNNDSLLNIFNRIHQYCDIIPDETKGGKHSRDFTVSVTNKPKIIIHKFKN